MLFRSELFVLDAWAGADKAYRMPVRVVTEFAWHNLFARNMFIPENNPAARAAHQPEFTVIDLPNFKADPANKGAVCRVGLWGWSRHPNYFFEWLIWVSFAVFALGSPWGWVGICCPILMLYFLLRVTGIPATEAHAVRSRGEAYRQYQREVSAFVPRAPKV